MEIQLLVKILFFLIILGLVLFIRKKEWIKSEGYFFTLLIMTILIGGYCIGLKGFNIDGSEFGIIEKRVEKLEFNQKVALELFARETVNNGRFGDEDQLKQTKEILKTIYKENTDKIINLYIQKGIYKVSPEEKKGVIDPNAGVASESESYLIKSLNL